MILPVGDCAVSVQFGEAVDLSTNAKVLALDRNLTAAALPGVVEMVPTYRSLMVHFDPLQIDSSALAAAIQRCLAEDSAGAMPSDGRRWQVPVGYGGEFGMDLSDIAVRHGLSEEAVVAIHVSATYHVYMIGFAPGFAYLGGLPEGLHTPRRSEPRMLTPAGSVSIGGAQSAIASVPLPSGWHMIGRTPFVSFDPKRDQVFLFQPGDIIRFTAISPADWHSLSGRLQRGEVVPGPDRASA
ncbi:5-oxoprolinase subunit PxpB [Thalassobaculum sp.]|uniref:5-oxoprolinase subunit PxpB n=1 Tax=Thalassobaculum sp. TaxID=2022740 RepID=UPI0032F07083